MDCEKFETHMIDELYDELDELTSAAAKRHVAGCARCAAMLGGLRATRRVLTRSGGLEVAPPMDLEERILAAARDAQKVVPIRSRVSTVVSWAGTWAMKPQSQMAAVFLLMIGGSVFLLRGTHASKSSTASAPMTVTEQGAPATSALTRANEENVDPQSAAAAHGTQDFAKGRSASAAAPNAPAIVAAAEPPSVPAPLPAATVASNGIMDGFTGGAASTDKLDNKALGQAMPRDEDMPSKVAMGAGPTNAGAIGGGGGPGAPANHAQRPSRPRALTNDDNPFADNPVAKAPSTRRAGAPAAAPPPAPVAVTAPASPSQSLSQPEAEKKKEGYAKDASTFDTAKAAYDAKNFAEATRQFDAIASGGDLNAALWAARSVRQGSGCAAAVARFAQIASRARSSTIGNDAALEAGQCYRQNGAFESARSQLVPLLTVTSHAARAQQVLNTMPPSAAARPAPRKAAPDQQQQMPYNSNDSNSLNKANAF